LKNHPELKDAQIMRLAGTTKPTIATIKERKHWNINNLVPQDPVALGICTQIDLDAEVQKAADRVARERKAAGMPAVPEAGITLQPTERMIDAPGMGPQPDMAPYDGGLPSRVVERASAAEEEAAMLEQLRKMGDGKKDKDEVGDEPSSG
jgi:hypothetical protein